MLFSAAGSLASGATMLLLHRTLGEHISLVGISIMGALASNLAQIGSARLLIFGEERLADRARHS